MAKAFHNAKDLLARVQDFTQPIRTFEDNVHEDWTDFNGHMNEARYLDCFSTASDALMQLIGCDEAYIAAGKSFFTVETHIVHLDEARVNEPVFATTQILAAQGKKLRIYHVLYSDDGPEPRALASGEQMLLHVDLSSRKVCDPEPVVAKAIQHYCDQHKDLSIPASAGRRIGQK